MKKLLILILAFGFIGCSKVKPETVKVSWVGSDLLVYHSMGKTKVTWYNTMGDLDNITLADIITVYQKINHKVVSWNINGKQRNIIKDIKKYIDKWDSQISGLRRCIKCCSVTGWWKIWVK
jgi:hypothetical protein